MATASPDAMSPPGDAGVEPAPLGGGLLGDQQHRTTPLTADGKPLQEAQHRQDHGSGRADRGVARDQADSEAHHADGDECSDQHCLAADLIADATEDERAERTGHEPRGHGRERQHRADRRGHIREENVWEDDGCQGGVDIEVVPLDGGGQQARQADSAKFPRTDGGRRR